MTALPVTTPWNDADDPPPKGQLVLGAWPQACFEGDDPSERVHLELVYWDGEVWLYQNRKRPQDGLTHWHPITWPSNMGSM